jgi:hypothetical protein
VTLIDFEYAGYNPPPYDIANFFCEMAANYAVDNSDGFLLIYGTYFPDVATQRQFVRAYAAAAGRPSDDAAVEGLRREVLKFVKVGGMGGGVNL